MKDETLTQRKVISFFVEKLKYTYIGNLETEENSNLREGDIFAFLTQKMGYSETLSRRAIEKLKKNTINLSQGLYFANKEVYTSLKYGEKVKDENSSADKTVYFIDFKNPGNNNFCIAEEVTVVGNNEKRPDLVIYLNGIAVAVIELKRSAVSVAEGVRQNIANQRERFIQKFFTTIQFCVAGNESEGLKYGTILTPEKKHLVWKEDGYTDNASEINEIDAKISEKVKKIEGVLFQSLYELFYKSRFINLIENFIIFDKGRKKVCRYNQYYGIMRAQSRLRKKQNGIIWHTQGSGKSLTMVWLSKWIVSNLPKSRVLIITDREELDDQMEKLYIGVNEKIYRTTSGRDLLQKLNEYEERIICSLVHKFGRRGGEATEKDYEKYIEELKASLPRGFSAKDDIYVFVDECHRTQSGKLHLAMKTILPKATFIGFTGTPLLKKDKKTSIEVFGRFIHTYKYNEGVEDGVVLDLKYEARDIPQDISSQDRIDQWFDSKTKGLMPAAKAKLKQKWANMQVMYSSRTRLEKIANDIIFDFSIKQRLENGTGNAILVADSIYSACKYYEIFQAKNFKKCAIISSYTPNKGDLRTEAVSDEEDTETFEKYNIYLKMLGIDPEGHVEGADISKKVEAFETEAKRKFVEEPANMKLLIVVDKLLTGFDAEPCTYLYIDKSMQDHGLFQAVCRVNRLDDESKDYGYIVDYKQLFGSLSDAMNVYTSENPFAGYDEKDVEGLLKNRKEETQKHFNEILEALNELCEGVAEPRGELEYNHYFCGENGVDLDNDELYARLRDKLYSLVNKLIRAYAEFKPYFEDFDYSTSKTEAINKQVVFYTELKAKIGRASGDFIDLKAYEPDMRYLIDTYVIASDSQKIGEFDDYTLLDFIISQEETLKNGDSNDESKKKKAQSAAENIERNISKEIVERKVLNPKYYERMSKILQDLIEERRKGVISYTELIAKYKEHAKNVKTPQENTHYPENIRHCGALRAFYDNFGEDAEIAIKLHNAVLSSKMDSFRNDPVKERRIKKALFQILRDEKLVEDVFKIVIAQDEY